MDSLTKEKILGQFFSGVKIPELLISLIRMEDVSNAIDPMCGSGDMFRPLLKHNTSLYGIEIDKCIAKTTQLNFPDAKITIGNAFDRDTLSFAVKDTGYDLVITNPPYVRRELLNPISSRGYHNDLNSIKSSLIEILGTLSYIPAKEKEEIRCCLNSISNLSDLSIPAWILCLILLRPGGQLAIVVPTAWLNREYARPIISLLQKLCSVDYIIVDANRIWFKDSAQVQTSLVVARRNYPGVTFINKTVKFVRLFSKACSDSSLTGNLPKGVSFIEYINKGQSLTNFFEVECIAPEYLLNCEESMISQRSKLAMFIDDTIDVSLTFEDLKVNVGQGLRTGANKFFYLEREDDKCHSTLTSRPIEYVSDFFYPVIKNQEILTGHYAITSIPRDVVLYIQNAVIKEDQVQSNLFNYYDVLPASIEEYIKTASNLRVNNKLIPELSAVKTNAVKGSAKRIQRFWYMLPSASERHYASVFLPRINSGSPISRINASGEKIFLDANFTNFWLQPDSSFTEYSLLALLNSTWLRIQFEELGSVFGGGALKLDAVQIKKCVLPSRILERVSELDFFGRRLSECSTDRSKSIIKQIDSLILDALFINEPNATELLNNILNSYLSCRNQNLL